MGVGSQRHHPALYHWERDSVPSCIGGSGGPRAGLDGCGKSRPRLVIDPRNIQPVA